MQLQFPQKTNEVLNRMRRWFRNRNIRTKINAIYVLLIAGQTLVLTAAAVMIFTAASIQSTVKQLQGNSRLVMTDIENIMENAESYSNDLTVRLNNYFVADRSLDLSNEYAEYNHDMTLKKIFRNVLYVYPQLYSVMFITPEGRVIASDNLITGGSYAEITDAWAASNQKTDEGNRWLNMDQYAFTDGISTVLPLCKRIVNIDTGKYIGFLSIMINETTFSDVYSHIDGDGAAYFFCNGAGTVVSCADPSRLLKPISNASLQKWIVGGKGSSHIMTIGHRRVLVTKSEFSKTGWKLVGIVPMRRIETDSRKIGLCIILLGLVCMGAAMLLSNILSASITRPLCRLIHDVQHLKLDNLDDVTRVESDDDVGLLAKSFNSMKGRINELLTNNMIEKEKQRKSELKLLQAQIKPHFLYNSLQLIYAMIDMSDRKKALKSVKALADFYRTALSRGRDIITVEEELANISDYLYIQKIRFADVFDYTIDCPAEYRKYRIPKLTLQPIVENSVNHGFGGHTVQNGRIGVRVTKDRDTLVIVVTDNGKGMDPERISEIFRAPAESTRESFGLKNIDERIRLYFGYSYGLKISSEPGKGTSVCLYIPAIETFSE